MLSDRQEMFADEDPGKVHMDEDEGSDDEGEEDGEDGGWACLSCWSNLRSEFWPVVRGSIRRVNHLSLPLCACKQHVSC